MSRPFLLSLGVGLALGFLPAVASAAAKDAEASALAKEAMDGDYLATRFKDAEKKLQKALKSCSKKTCSAEVRATLHLDLAIVYLAGLKQKDKGKKEMKAAIAADSGVELNPDFSTPEVEKAFLAAGGVKKEPEPAPVDLEEEESPAPAATAEPEPESASGSPKNWLSISFQQDLLAYSATTNVCASQQARGAEQYQCFLQGASYEGSIYPGAGNQLQGGVGFATRRVLVGLDHLFGENLSLGLRLGFAFAGSPKATTPDAKGFLPLHAELRASYWFGEKPFAEPGIRPYLGLAAGLAEVDGHVTVEYFEDQMGYQNNAKGKLDAWRKTGNTLVGLHAGLAYGFSREHQLFVELRLLQLLGAGATGAALKLGYAYGL